MKSLGKLTLFFLLVLTSYSYAQYDSITAGIMPFCDMEKNNQKTDILLSELTDALSRYRFIKLVERSKLKEVVQEIKFGMTGMVDEATAVKAGKIQGLQIMIVGTLRKNKITARAIHTETSQVIVSYSVSGISGMDILGKKLAAGVETFLARENLKSLRNDSPKLALDFWVERKDKGKITSGKKGVVKIGESVVFHFKSNKKGYLTIVDIQPGGDVVILFPNDMSPDNKISAGKTYSIPSEDDGFEITVSEPVGRDTVVAFFTKKKVDWLDRKKLTGEGFWTVKENEKFYMSRGFKVKATKLKRAAWESKVLEIDIEK